MLAVERRDGVACIWQRNSGSTHEVMEVTLNQTNARNQVNQGYGKCMPGLQRPHLWYVRLISSFQKPQPARRTHGPGHLCLQIYGSCN